MPTTKKKAPRKKAAPKESTRVQPSRRKGWLVCDRCSMTLEFVEGHEGWPLHRCLDPIKRISEVRPFTKWSDQDPKPRLPRPDSSLYPAGWI